MEKNKKFKIKTNYFEKAPSWLAKQRALSGYEFSHTQFSSKSPCIFVSPNVSAIDKYLISSCIKDKFVFLKQDIVSKISNESITKKEHEDIIKEIQKLKDNNISICMIYNEYPSLFGENQEITKGVALFLYQTNLDIIII